jgi:hypothetical protein
VHHDHVGRLAIPNAADANLGKRLLKGNGPA